jgi:hypothetical protein
MRPLHASARVFRLLLCLYSSRFRHAYGAEMEQIFCRRLSRAKDRGTAAFVHALAHAYADLIASAISERFAGPANTTPRDSMYATFARDLRFAARTFLRRPAFVAHRRAHVGARHRRRHGHRLSRGCDDSPAASVSERRSVRSSGSTMSRSRSSAFLPAISGCQSPLPSRLRIAGRPSSGCDGAQHAGSRCFRTSSRISPSTPWTGEVAFGVATLTSNLRKLVLYEGWPVPDPTVYALSPGVEKRMDALLEKGDRDGVVETLFRSYDLMSDEDWKAFRAAPSWARRKNYRAGAPAHRREQP